MSRLELYKDLIDFFFENDIEFRCILIKNKQKLDHDQYNQGDINNFYYKSIYLLLKNPYTNPANHYRMYLDIKDTRGRNSLKKIEEVFQNKHKGHSPFIYFQHIHSQENEFIQLADLFIGAATYKARDEHLKPEASKVKLAVIEYLGKKSGYCISEGTEPWEA